MIGIYKISNKTNSKVYIGQSIDIKKRWKEHISNCKYKRYVGYSLYKAFTKYGVDNFEFEIICQCSINELDTLEIEYIGKYNSFSGNGYNMTMGGDNPRGTLGFTGRKHRLTTKKKISEYNKGENNQMYGKHHSLESRKKISDAKRGKKVLKINNCKKVICITTGKIFHSVKSGAEYYNCSAGNIPKCCTGKVNSAGTLADGRKLAWMYYEQYLETNEEQLKIKIELANKGFKGSNNPMSRAVVCLNDGKVFNTIKETSEYYNITIDSVGYACKKKYKKPRKYSFMYLDEQKGEVIC